jgi:hypothetical protein
MQPIPATVHSYNPSSDVWAFTTAGDVWYAKHVDREVPPVGTPGAILQYGNPDGNFDFSWHTGAVSHDGVFKRSGS